METENQFQNGRELHKAERLINKLNAFFFRICPSLYSLAYCNNRPFHNIYTNLSELGGSMMCQYKQLQNLTNMQKAEMKANKDLIKQALSGYKEMSAQKNDLSGLIDGLYTEMEGNTQSKTHAGPLLTSKDSISKENNYYEKNLKRCLEIIKSGEKQCVDNMKLPTEKFVSQAKLFKICKGKDCGTTNAVDESCSFEKLNKNSKHFIF